MPRPPRPDDLAALRIASGPRLSPAGDRAVVTVKTATPTRDDYRHALWLVPLDGASPARRLTIGAKHDRHARFSPDGRTLAFLSDRRLAVEDEPDAPTERDDGTQIHLLPLDGGEARRLTDLPRGVDDFEWSPDGRQLVAVSASRGVTRAEDARRRGKHLQPRPGAVAESDYRYVDRLHYQYNGTGFINDRVAHLWLVDAQTGLARALFSGPSPEHDPAWSPDGSRIAFSANRRPDRDLRERSDVYIIDVASGTVTRITGGDDAVFGRPTWLPDGRTIVAFGGRYPAIYRTDLWLFAADGSDAGPHGGRNLSGRHDIMPASTMNSDVTLGEAPQVVSSADGRRLTFSAPADGAYELWRIAVESGELERLTTGRHYISAFDQRPTADGGERVVYLRSTPTSPPDVFRLDLPPDGPPASAPTRSSELNADVLVDVALVEPVERRVMVDGREIQGWLLPAGDGRRPLVTEIHGGPHTFYGWAPVWEFQVLAAAGMSVFYCNPRGSEGYGREFNEANRRDWGDGPMVDVLAGIDALVADGLADPDRLGVTGGSYGGYLTNWIIAHDDRFGAAITCRSVSDMAMLFLTGDISGGDWAIAEFESTPWDDPEYFRQISPITYANRIRTPLLIQHSERDLRTTMGQAESLFTVLRSKRRPVRMMRVPDESHELTRSGTPFRRVENLVQVRDWFAHYLVRGRRGLPPLPRR
jgi:dipeptidyl aminopeptidase/acylaminoacyl peptidase